MTRKFTNKLIEMMDEGYISPQAIAEMCLAWMSEDSVKQMCLANDLLLEDDEDEETDEDEEEQ